MPKCNQRSPLEVLQWLFENEDTLPKNRTALLKHVGWIFARRAGMNQNLSDMGYGLMCDMFSELMQTDGGVPGQAMSGEFALREHPVGLYSTTSPYRTSQKPGWHLARIMQLHNYGEYSGGLFVFTYTMPPPEGHVLREPLNPEAMAIPVTDLHWNCHRANPIWDPECQRKLALQKFSFTQYMATFELNGVTLYLLEHETQTFLALGSQISQQGFGCPGQPNWDMEFVSFGEPHTSFVHGLYNAKTQVASATETNPDTLTIRHAIRRFPDKKNKVELPPHHEARVFHTGYKGLQVSHRYDYLLNDDGRAKMDVDETAHNVMDLVRSMEYIANLVTMTSQWTHKSVHINYALGEAMRSRIFRIAYKFLVIMGEKAELKRAADPVRKCAACAVQAAKSQLVLGIEGPDAKRQRT